MWEEKTTDGMEIAMRFLIHLKGGTHEGGYQSCSHIRNRSSSAIRSAAAIVPMIFTTKLSSTVETWAFTPHGTLSPAARHSLTGKSVFGSTEETGTRKRSDPLRPM